MSKRLCFEGTMQQQVKEIAGAVYGYMRKVPIPIEVQVVASNTATEHWDGFVAEVLRYFGGERPDGSNRWEPNEKLSIKIRTPPLVPGKAFKCDAVVWLLEREPTSKEICALRQLLRCQDDWYELSKANAIDAYVDDPVAFVRDCMKIRGKDGEENKLVLESTPLSGRLAEIESGLEGDTKSLLPDDKIADIGQSILDNWRQWNRSQEYPAVTAEEMLKKAKIPAWVWENRDKMVFHNIGVDHAIPGTDKSGIFTTNNSKEVLLEVPADDPDIHIKTLQAWMDANPYPTRDPWRLPGDKQPPPCACGGKMEIMPMTDAVRCLSCSNEVTREAVKEYGWSCDDPRDPTHPHLLRMTAEAFESLLAFGVVPKGGWEVVGGDDEND